MKKLILLTGLFLASLTLNAQVADIAPATKGQEYGSGVSEAQTFDVYSADKLVREMSSKDKLENLVIRAEVSGVCEKKGCWLTLVNDMDTRVFVKMKDYAFFLPQDIMGKTILLDADAEKMVTSVKELKHYAQDAGKSASEIAKITKPQTEIRVLASGIKVVN
ncbi:DUF4920 domain-containing protein [Chryseobacterium sp. A301]